MDKVHFILNEMVMGGMVLETSLQEIVSRFHEQEKIVKQEVKFVVNCMFAMVSFRKKLANLQKVNCWNFAGRSKRFSIEIFEVYLKFKNLEVQRTFDCNG